MNKGAKKTNIFVLPFFFSVSSNHSNNVGGTHWSPQLLHWSLLQMVLHINIQNIVYLPHLLGFVVCGFGFHFTVADSVVGRHEDQWTSQLADLLMVSGAYPVAPLVCIAYQTAAYASPGQIIEGPTTCFVLG